jgi:hypothetical protein
MKVTITDTDIISNLGSKTYDIELTEVNAVKLAVLEFCIDNSIDINEVACMLCYYDNEDDFYKNLNSLFMRAEVEK